MIAVPLLACCVVLHAAENPPAPSTPTSRPDYRLGVNDVISVSVYGEPDLSTKGAIVIPPDGFISTPMSKDVQALGKTRGEIEKEITSKLSSVLTHPPEVTVTVVEVNSNKVSVGGEVKNPNSYKIGDRATVIDAITLAGGFTDYAKEDRVVVIRTKPDGSQDRIQLNVQKMLKKKADLFYVQPNDVIWVE
jgi:polysaccharide export outer membrane protein